MSRPLMTASATLQVLQVFPSLDGGGVSQDTLRLCKFLKNKNCTVHLACGSGILSEEAADAQLVHHSIPFWSKNPLVIWKNALRLRRLCTNHSFDIVHVHSRAPAVSCWLAFGLMNRPRLSFLFGHSLRKTVWLSTYHAFYEHKNWLQRFYAGFMLKGRAVISISQSVHQHILKTYNKKLNKKTPFVRCIPRGIDTQFFCPNQVDKNLIQQWRHVFCNASNPAHTSDKNAGDKNAGDCFVLLLPARPRLSKGHAVLINSLLWIFRHHTASIVKNQDPLNSLHPRSDQSALPESMLSKIRLVCPGVLPKSSYAQKLMETARQNADTCPDVPKKHIQNFLHRQILFLPYQKDMRPLYAAANLVVLPTLKPEGFGLVLAESMAMGTPALSFNWGGAQDIIQDKMTGFLAPLPKKSELSKRKTLAWSVSLADTLLHIFRTSEKDFSSLGPCCRKRIQNHFQEQVAHAETWKLYNNLIVH